MNTDMKNGHRQGKGPEENKDRDMEKGKEEDKDEEQEQG